MTSADIYPWCGQTWIVLTATRRASDQIRGSERCNGNRIMEWCNEKPAVRSSWRRHDIPARLPRQPPPSPSLSTLTGRRSGGAYETRSISKIEPAWNLKVVAKITVRTWGAGVLYAPDILSYVFAWAIRSFSSFPINFSKVPHERQRWISSSIE